MTVLNKYYAKTDKSPLYIAALILHPSRRLDYIRAHWPKKFQEPAIRAMKKLWEDYREKNPSPESHKVSETPRNLPAAVGKSIFDQFAQDLSSYLPRPRSFDEFEDYCTEDPVSIGTGPAIYWWAEEKQQKRFPRLSLMAIDILSIPAMSDEPERVFSGARRTLSWQRSRMRPEIIEMCQCVKQWGRSDSFFCENDDDLDQIGS